MKTMRKLSVAFAAVALATASGVASADCSGSGNLAANCGFETGDFTGWTLAGLPSGPDASDYVGVESGPDPFGGITPHGGLYQAYFSNYSADTGTLSQSIATSVGTSYTVSFWAAQQSEGPTGSSGPVDLLSATFGSGSVSATNIVDGGYLLYSFTGVASAASTDFTLSMSDTYGEFIVDDVSVTAPTPAIPEPSVLSLLGAGALMLGLVRRRSRQPR